MMQSDPRFTNRALMGTLFWFLIVGPAVKMAELEGRWVDWKMRHNFGEPQ